MRTDQIMALAPDSQPPQPLTLAGLRRLVDDLAGLGSGPASLAQVVAVLDRHGRTDLPVDKVAVLLSTVAELDGSSDAAAGLTPRALETLLARVS
jgi:hypothetical protein